jgi:outer membrane protein TolC
MERYLTGTILFLCITATSFSQRILTVEEAVATALQNNYDIRLLRNDSTLFELTNSYAYAAFLPRLNATTGLVYNVNNSRQELADGTKRQQNNLHSNNLSASINLNWTIFDGFKMFATRDKLAEFVKLGKWNVRNQLINSIAVVINTYYNIVSEKQRLKAIEDQMALNEERITQADKKLTVGLGAKPELLQARLDLNAQKAERLNQLTVMVQLKEDLNKEMAVVPGTDYDVTDSIPIDQSLIVSEVYAGAETNNPVLLAASTQINIAQLSLKERKAERFPILGINAAYNFSRNINKAVINPFTTLFNQNHGFNYGLTATIPIFNNFTVKRQIKEAEIEIDYRKLIFDYEKLKVNAAISSAYRAFEMQKQTLALEEENIASAKENVSIAAERYRLGLSTIVELRETQRSLSEAYTRLINARYNTKVSETELLRLRGDLVR